MAMVSGKNKKGVTMLTEKQLIKIFEEKSWDKLNKKQRREFDIFMFGEEFMQSDDKGAKKTYNN